VSSGEASFVGGRTCSRPGGMVSRASSLPSVRTQVSAWLALALLFLAGCATLPQTRVSLAEIPAEQRIRARQNLTVFNAVWDLVNRKHYDSKFRGVDWEAAAATFGPRAAAAPDEKALYRVLNEMLAPLADSHTHALTPAQVTERRTKVRARTGFNMTRVENRWVVSEVLPGSPAEEAGVKSGWIVVARNGEPLGERIDFRPSVGEDASWDFLDEHDQKVRLSPAARRLSIASRQMERELEDGFVYLRFDEFDATDRRWLSRELKKHAAAPGVVIDLRRNPGGETFSLGISIGEFFDRAVDCGTFISREGSRRMQTSWQIGSARYRGQVVVLVEGATGSAAEIFAAVMQDHGRATIVGRRTAGAVLASWFYRLPDGGELQLSRLDYIAPKGRRIEAVGVEPDIVVPRTLRDLRAGRDRDLEEALNVLRRGRQDAAPGPERSS
jgi:carboxyl-terminal processing protease